MKRRRFHQAVFALAGAYNLAWGAYSAIDPQWLFRYAGMPPLHHPALVACLGMVVGVYGLLYGSGARAGARIRDRGGRLARKVLGPIGLVQLIARGDWPMKSVILCVTNDFIWWIPFVLYLWDCRNARRRETSAARTSPAAPA